MMTLREHVIFLTRMVDHLISTILNIKLKIQPKNFITVTIEFKVFLIFVAYIVYFIFYLKREIKRRFFSLDFYSKNDNYILNNII